MTVFFFRFSKTVFDRVKFIEAMSDYYKVAAMRRQVNLSFLIFGIKLVQQTAVSNSMWKVITCVCFGLIYTFALVFICQTKYFTQVVRDNTTILDYDNNWNLLLYKEAYFIKRLSPSLNNGLKSSRELHLFS